jgi:tRNA threonylcarbamoyladenosine biosynthesis protein TsaE
MKITTNSEQETFDFARKYAKTLKGGEVIGLIGDLGAGKTVFAKGLAAGLGIKGNVNSPTFVIMKVYEIKNKTSKIKKLVHIDAYRMKSSAEAAGIGLEDYIHRNNVIVIEWPQNIQSLLPKDSILFHMKNLSKNNRSIKTI